MWTTAERKELQIELITKNTNGLFPFSVSSKQPAHSKQMKTNKRTVRYYFATRHSVYDAAELVEDSDQHPARNEGLAG